jgi:hypothetical protein
MAHLYLPTAHSDDDLVLAGQVAQAMDAAELFVVWTREAGPGAAPRVEAILRESTAPPAPAREADREPPSLAAAVRRAWRALTRRAD